jgi:hypothetical protein
VISVARHALWLLRDRPIHADKFYRDDGERLTAAFRG